MGPGRAVGATLTAAALSCVLGLAVGCGPNTDPDTEVLRSGDTYLLKETEEYTGDVGGMGFSGVLAIVDGCVGVQAAEPLVIVFPPSAQLEGEGDDVVVSVDGVRLQVGDSFDAGTRSTADGRPLSAFGDLEDQAPDSCRHTSAIQLDEFE